MRRLFLLVAFVVLGACTDLIAPEDPMYEEVCVIYVGENESAQIPKEVFDRCLSVEIVVVRFDFGRGDDD